MQARTSITALMLSSLAFAGAAQAADAKLVTYFKETCGACHGEKGEGTPGLAPPLKGSKFVTGGTEAELATTITKGRAGADKRYKEYASPMPPASMSDGRLKGLIAYMKGELQK